MFRFTIRELLILTVTAGLAVGWWLDHRASLVEKAEIVKAAERTTYKLGVVESGLRASLQERKKGFSGGLGYDYRMPWGEVVSYDASQPNVLPRWPAP